MTTDTSNTYTRLLQEAAREFRQPIDELDPLVRWILRWITDSESRLQRQLEDSRQRILHQLAERLCPQILRGPLPVSAIAQAMPSGSPSIAIGPENQFSAEGMLSTEGGPQNQTITLSPAGRFQLYNRTVQWIAHGKCLYRPGTGESLIRAEGPSLPPQELWIGLQQDEGLEQLEGTAFFFCTPGTEAHAFYRLLPFGQWSIGGHILHTRSGYSSITTAGEAPNSISYRINRQAQLKYKHQFITVNGWNSGLDAELTKNKSTYPAAFQSVFPVDGLEAALQEELVWISISFPRPLPDLEAGSIQCAVNTFPVVERKLVSTTYNQRIVPLSPLSGLQHPGLIDEHTHWLDIHRVYSSSGDFIPALDAPLSQAGPGTYALNQGYVGKFDNMDARSLLERSIQAVEEESQAFPEMNRAQVRHLLSQLKSELPDQEISHTGKTFLELNPFQSGERVHVEFWSTTGLAANGSLSAGTPLQASRGIRLQGGSLVLLTTLDGGRSPLSEEEQLHALRSSFHASVPKPTAATIARECRHWLGKHLKEVNIRTRVVQAASSNNGLVKALWVELFPTQDSQLSKTQWESHCAFLESWLEDRYPGYLTFRVVTSKEENTKTQNL